uniref:FACT complex subunit SSRP1 n=1 Tax=Aureoumbra lagunensis TaxID=44058 RepID=A0A7S3JR02_9STRA
MSDRTTFMNIKTQGRSGVGSLSIDETTIRWTPRGEDASTGRRLDGKNVSLATWSMFGKRLGSCCIYDKDGEGKMRCDGFVRKDREKLADALKKCGGGNHTIRLEDREYSSAGLCGGSVEFEESRLVLRPAAGMIHHKSNTEKTEIGEEEDVEATKRIFEVDARHVSQCVLPSGIGSKGGEPKEVTMQFVENDAGDGDEHQLVELRVWVPPDAPIDNEDLDDDREPGATRLQQRIMKLSKMRAVTGDMLAEFASDDGTFLLPRGRYGVEMYSSFFRMHGNMYDYKIAYSDVERYILLPKNDDIHYVLIIALDKPIRQGQQRYAFLVWQLKRSDASIDINLTDQAIIDRYGENTGLKPSLTGPYYQLVARVFKVLSSKKVYTTGKFKSSDDRHAVSCSVKARTGQLYPLERSFVFIHQPTLVLRFEDIAAVEFERFSGYGQGSATRNFDLRVTMKSSSTDSGKNDEHVFTSIERTEYNILSEFLSNKNLKIKNLQTAETEQQQQLSNLLDDDDDDDDDAGADGSMLDSEEEDDDFVPEKPLPSSSKKKRKADDDESDDDESDDDEPVIQTKKKKTVAKSTSSSKQKRKSAAPDQKKKKET